MICAQCGREKPEAPCLDVEVTEYEAGGVLFRDAVIEQPVTKTFGFRLIGASRQVDVETWAEGIANRERVNLHFHYRRRGGAAYEC